MKKSIASLMAPPWQGSWWEVIHAGLTECLGKPAAPSAIDPAQVLGDAPGDDVRVRYAD